MLTVEWKWMDVCVCEYLTCPCFNGYNWEWDAFAMVQLFQRSRSIIKRTASLTTDEFHGGTTNPSNTSTLAFRSHRSMNTHHCCVVIVRLFRTHIDKHTHTHNRARPLCATSDWDEAVSRGRFAASERIHCQWCKETTNQPTVLTYNQHCMSMLRWHSNGKQQRVGSNVTTRDQSY